MSNAQRRVLFGIMVLIALVYGSSVALLNRMPGSQPEILPTLANLPGDTALAAATPAPEADQAATAVALDRSSPGASAGVPVASSAAGEQPARPHASDVFSQRIEGQVVLRFRPGTSAADQQAYIASFGGEALQNISALNAVVVRIPQNLAQIGLPPASIVAATEPDYTVSALATPNDPRYSEQWALPALGAEAAWAAWPVDTPAVTIAVVDSGICASHPDLAGRIVPGRSFLASPSTEDAFGHGCAMSGVIAANANNALGIAGLAPNAQIMPLRVLDERGIGSYSAVASAIVYAADHNISIVNLSLGGTAPSQVLADAVAYATGRGVTLIAAAGNTGSRAVLYPAAYASVVSVGSVNSQNLRSAFSSHGVVDLYAPGEGILTTALNGDYVGVDGTSIAAAFVSGLAAVESAFGRSLKLDGGIARFGGANTVVVGGGETPSVAQVDAAVTEAIAADGSARVLVHLQLPVSAQGLNTPSAAIAQAQQSVLAQLNAGDFTLAHQFSSLPAFAGELTASGLQTLRRHSSVARIYLDEPTQAASIRSAVSIRASQVQAGAINATPLTGTGVNIAVIDSGINMANPAVADSVVAQKCFSSTNGCPGGLPTGNTAPDELDHGTNISAIITAPDGVAPGAGIVALRVLDAYGRGYASDWIAALDWIAQQADLPEGVRVDAVNMSLGSLKLYKGAVGGASDCDSFFPLETIAIHNVLNRGIPVVAATGNQGSADSINSPACISGVISVGAVYDQDLGPEPDTGTYFSNLRGNWPNCKDNFTSPAMFNGQQQVACFSNSSSWVDVLAPGAQIIVGNTGGSGTSQAAPHVTGVVALMLQASKVGLTNIEPTPARVEAILRSTGPSTTDWRNGLGFRVVDAVDAVNALVNPVAFTNCSEIMGTTESQCNALVAFFESTQGEGWLQNAGWKKSNNPCTWLGITCDAGGNITQIQLVNNNLRGTLPPAFFNLPQLTSLNLFLNQIGGGLPPELANLSSLVELNLNSNRFSGSLPNVFASLPDLLSLDLSFNSFSGSLPASLGALTQLEYLNVSVNQLTGPLPDLSNLSQLKTMEVNINQLSGELPEWVGTLPSLERFAGYFNQFSGPIPGSLGTAPSLKDLQINNNEFSGAVPGALFNSDTLELLILQDNPSLGWTLPETMNGQSLFTINVRNTGLHGQIPAGIAGLTSLRYLFMSSNQLSGSIGMLGTLTLVDSMNLENNFLTGGLPDFSGMPYLRFLDLSNNRLNGDISITQYMVSVDLSFNRFNSLTQAPFVQDHLDLSHNLLTAGGISPTLSLDLFVSLNLGYNQIDPSALSPGLQSLLLSHTSLNNGLSTQLLPIPFTYNVGLGQVEFSISDIAEFTEVYLMGRDPDIGSMVYIINQLECSSFLPGSYSDCAWNPVTDNKLALRNLVPGGLYELQLFGKREFLVNYDYPWSSGEVLSTDTMMVNVPGDLDSGICSAVDLDVPSNECFALMTLYAAAGGPNWTNDTGWGTSATVCNWYGITCSATTPPNVTEIALPNNNLVGGLTEYIDSLPALEYLDLSRNALSGSLTSNLSNLDLRVLLLHNNQFVGNLPFGMFGPYSGGQRRLERLEISNNRFTGPLPEDFSYLQNLVIFNASNNRLSGQLSEGIGDAASLELLALAVNSLSGSIPSQIGQLSNLKLLDLAFNQFSGSIPNEINNLANVENISLAYNRLSGPIPVMSGLTQLYTIDLGSNQLSGSLPTSFASLSNLTDLNLYWNRLSGPIPSVYGNLANLQRLDLRGNQLSGSIPPELGNLGNLAVLDLSTNELSGVIPQELGNLAALQTLILGSNQLSGEIPNTLGNLDNVAILFLDRNRLSGSIPDQLANANQLVWLKLDNNRLIGNIPSTFSSANVPMLGRLELQNNLLTGYLPFALSTLPLNLDGGISTYNNRLVPDETMGTFVQTYEPFFHDEQIAPPDTVRVVAFSPEGTVVGWRPQQRRNVSMIPRRYEAHCGPFYFGPFELVASAQENSFSGVISQLTLPNVPPGESRYCIFRSVYTTSYGLDVASDFTFEYLIEASPFGVQIPVEVIPSSFEVNVPEPQQPENLTDVCSEATGRGVTFTGTGRSVTFTATGRGVTFTGTGRGVTFTGTGTLTADTSGSAYDTVLTVWRVPAEEAFDESNPNLELITCNDNVETTGEPGDPNAIERPPASPSYTSQVTVPFSEDYDLYFVVFSKNDESGTLIFNIDGQLDPAAGNVAQSEINALTNLYAALGGPQWANSSGWFTTPNPCYWYGVTCGLSGQFASAQATNTIIALNLQANGLRGSIPASIADLPSLQSLDLSHNALTGDIPQAITTLSALTSLDVGYNALTASGGAAALVVTLQPDWASTQTVPPSGLSVSGVGPYGFTLSFTPIGYTGDGGYYEAGCALNPNGPFAPNNRSASKSASSIMVDGLMPNTTYYCAVRTFTPPHGIQVNALLSPFTVPVMALTLPAMSSDSDNDGVPNDQDLCPNTPPGQTVDANGCAQSQLDDDQDGVPNPIDLCPGTPTGETPNAQGCAPSQLDDDDDGVSNATDLCPATPTGAAVNAVGCADVELDDDGDGVNNALDQCPATPAGQAVDANGCAQSQLDDDGDGVFNPLDLCPNTPPGATVNAVGCANTQLDDDGDGVSNALDLCPATPPGAIVNADGCPLDSDSDGVFDGIDQCPATPAGAIVNAAGCPLDGDGDGVFDGIDQCPATPLGATVNAAGCPSDGDGDGVFDGIDQCPATPAGAVVNAVGCPSDGDGDGVFDGIDQCADTPPATPVDSAGCPLPPGDSDGDGVTDDLDQCPATPAGAVVDANGCPSDSDGDGVFDGIDQCAATPAGAIVNAVGCPSDGDGDGVFDGIDQCAATPAGAIVNAVGCPSDGDGDGVFDGIDQCPATPAGAVVNAVGCPSDGDGDGVFDGIDQCANTPPATPVDSAGCPLPPPDSDGDGITDDLDLCPGTASGLVVDANGCHASQLDTDNDGVNNGQDFCPNTPANEPVDPQGCSASQRDSDGDGVNDALDACPGTAPGTPVNVVGCPLTGRGSITIIHQTTVPTNEIFRYTVRQLWFRTDTDAGDATYPAQVTAGNLRPGSYRIAERFMPWYWYTSAVTCSDASGVLYSYSYAPGNREEHAFNLSLAADQQITCVFSHDKFAKLTIEKFVDSNNNSVRDAGEQRPAGWVFTLYQGGTPVGRPQTTRAGGLAYFERLVPGTYQLCETPKAGWVTADCVTVTLATGERPVLGFANRRLP